MSDMPFPDTPRVDAHDKVRGAALFGADDARPDMLHAALAVATIAQGRIISLDTRGRAAPCPASGWSSPTRISAT